MTSLKDLLTLYNVDVLKDIAREYGLDAKNPAKSALVDALARKFGERDRVARAVSSLNPVEQEIVTLIQRAGGEITVSAIRNILQKKELVEHTKPRQARTPWGFEQEITNPPGDPRYKGKPTLENAAARLLLLGLVFSRQVVGVPKQMIGWEPGRYLVIPKEILKFLPDPAAEKIKSAEEPASSESGSARNFQRDLSRYWSFVRRAGRLELTTQGWVFKKMIGEIAKSLGWTENKKREEKSDLYAFFLRRLLIALDLLKPELVGEWNTPSDTVFLPGEGTDFWTRPPADRIKASFEAWLDATTWNELRIPKSAYGHDHRRPAPPELKQARRVVVEAIKKRGATGWVNLADLLDDIRLSRYEFLFARKARPQQYYNYGTDYSSPYYQSNNPFGISYSDVTDEAGGWDKVEGAIITHMIAGPLHWLGLTDLGFDKSGDSPRAYRLTAMGAWLLGVGAPVTIAEEGGRVVVQPNFQIVAMEPIAENVLMTLDEFSQFEGGDHALTYRLTRESVYRGQRAGWTAARLIGYLEEATHAPLPQNVKRSLEEWQALHERITFRRGVPLLQAEDAATLDELLANSALAPKLGRRVAEPVALPDGNAQAAITALRDAGWLPVVTRRDHFNAPASVSADEEGNFAFVQRAPSIYSYEGVEPFAEIIDAHHARITRERANAAAQQGMSVPTMIARLRAVHQGELPPKLIVRLKAWGKYFGDAKMGTLTLIEFRDEQARGELLNDPELKPYLSRFDAGARPLALVQTDALERVQALLAERGVEIRAFK